MQIELTSHRYLDQIMVIVWKTYALEKLIQVSLFSDASPVISYVSSRVTVMIYGK